MKTITLFDPTTGGFGAVMEMPDWALTQIEKSGKAFKIGRFDKRTQRVDVATGQVVAYQRPDAELDAEQKAAREQRARRRIAELERQQARRVRELLAPSDARLQAIEDEIAGLRSSLAG